MEAKTTLLNIPAVDTNAQATFELKRNSKVAGSIMIGLVTDDTPTEAEVRELARSALKAAIDAVDE